jgi:hypothetical protein
MPSFFKAVPKLDLTGIRHNGLDPSQAMKVGGATMTAMAQVGRTPTATDKTAGTWLGKYEETARDYLDDEKIREGVILKITLPDDWLTTGKLVDQKGNYTTNEMIPPARISYQFKGQEGYTPVANWNGIPVSGLPDKWGKPDPDNPD